MKRVILFLELSLTIYIRVISLRIFLLFLFFSTYAYSQGDFLINYYNRDFLISKQEVISLFTLDPEVKISKDSANWLDFRGVKWLEFDIKKVSIIFVDDTIGNFVMVLKDTSEAITKFDWILNRMKMQFGRSANMIEFEDDYFIENRKWIKYLGIKEDSILQLSLPKTNPNNIYIAYMSITRLNKLFEKK